jgi:hypothetical protein
MNRRRRGGGIPWGLVGMLGLVGLAERLVARHDSDFLTAYAANYRFAAARAGREAKAVDLLCFGDSQMKFGIAPRIVAARSGRSAYNLAIVGGQPAASYFLLKRALQSGARPTLVVFDCKPSILQADFRWNVRNLPELLDARDALELAWSAGDASLFAALVLGRVCPSYHVRDEVREAIRAALRGESASKRPGVEPLVRNWWVNRGAMINTPNPRFTGQVPPTESGVYFPSSWERDRVSAAYVRRFLRLAAMRGVPVYWLLPPIVPEVQARREALGLDAQWIAFVRATIAPFPNVTVVDGRHSGYIPSVFVDPAHLDGRGAAALSAGLGEVVRRRPGPRRWVSLPAYRPALETLEDVERSKIAVRHAEASRR